MKILVTGATGLVGAEVVRQAMEDQDVSEITMLVRRQPDIPFLPAVGTSKLKTIIHNDFLDYTSMEEVFRHHDVCLWCLGISQSQVSKEQYHVITYDYTLAAAHALLKVNPAMTFIFVSGEGADPTEKSKTLFARVKGKTENELQRLPFRKLVIVRPGGIKPIHANPQAPWTNKIMTPLFPILNLLMPNMVITSVHLARVLLHLAKHDAPQILLRNADLKLIRIGKG